MNSALASKVSKVLNLPGNPQLFLVINYLILLPMLNSLSL